MNTEVTQAPVIRVRVYPSSTIPGIPGLTQALKDRYLYLGVDTVAAATALAITDQPTIFEIEEGPLGDIGYAIYDGRTPGALFMIAGVSYVDARVQSMQIQLNNKVDVVPGKGLSTNDYTNEEQLKLEGIATGATANQTDAYLTSRANHTGTQGAATIVEDATHRFMTDTERTKLTGIAAGATANQADAYLVNRANHTGTQGAATIVEDATHRFMTDVERAKLTGIAAGATANQTDAYLTSRANHTGTQGAATITEDATHRFMTDAERTKLTGIAAGAVDAAGAAAAAPVQSVAGRTGAIALAGEDIASGTVADARLTANVPLKGAANTFTQTCTFKSIVPSLDNSYVLGVNTARWASVYSVNTFADVLRSNSSVGIVVQNSSGTQLAKISDNGNIRIGSSSTDSGYKFHVDGITNFTDQMTITKSAGAAVLTLNGPSSGGGSYALNINGTTAGQAGGILLNQQNADGTNVIQMKNPAGIITQIWQGGATDGYVPNGTGWQQVKGDLAFGIYEAGKKIRIGTSITDNKVEIDPATGNVKTVGYLTVAAAGLAAITRGAATPAVPGGSVVFQGGKFWGYNGTVWGELSLLTS